MPRAGPMATALAVPFDRGEASRGFDLNASAPYTTALLETSIAPKKIPAMKVRSSLKTLKVRHRDCKLVRRKGRVYVINKTNPRYKARQG